MHIRNLLIFKGSEFIRYEAKRATKRYENLINDPDILIHCYPSLGQEKNIVISRTLYIHV